MRVAIGAIAGTIGGPATYAVELTRALASQYPDDSWTVLTDRPDLFSDFAETIHLPLRSAWVQPLWDHFKVRRALGRGRFDLYHGTKATLPATFPCCVSMPMVVTVHDMAVAVMPATFSRAQRIHMRIETRHAVRNAAAVVTVSRSSAADLRRFYELPADRIEVIPLASSADIRPANHAEVERWRAEHGVTGPTVGYLGTLQPRKNIDLLAEAFTKAAGTRPWTLLVAGRLRPGYRPACLDRNDARIRYLGEIDQAEVPLFLGALSCMVSPSSYEGFGLSFLEAMAAGCPVLGIANSSVPEVVGDAGLLVARADARMLADAIETVVTDVALAADLSRRGVERAALFSWKETARSTRAVYARVIPGRT